MFIFWRLLLAHLIADFPLQSDSIYGLKTKYPWGSFVHSGIFILLAILLLWPYWAVGGFWYFLLFLFLAHGFQDLMKIIFTRNSRHDTVWLFLIDQALHVVFISSVFLLPISLERFNFYNNPWLKFYLQDKLIIYLVFFIGVGFGGSILIPYVEKLVRRQEQVEIPPKYKYQGIVERLLIIALVSTPGYYFIFLPFVFLIRYFTRDKYSLTAVTVSMLTAALAGLLLRLYY